MPDRPDGLRYGRTGDPGGARSRFLGLWVIESGHTIITVSLQNLTEPTMGVPGSVTGSIRWFSLLRRGATGPEGAEQCPMKSFGTI